MADQNIRFNIGSAFQGEGFEKARQAVASVQKAFSRTLAASVQEVRDEVKALNDDFDRVTRQMVAFSKALDGVRSAQATGDIINLEIEKLNKVLAAHSEAEVQNIEATYNLQLAIEKRTNVENEGAAKIKEATDAITTAEQKVANIDEQIAAIESKRAELNEIMLSARESGDKNWIEIQAKITELAKQEAALEQAKIDKEAELNVLRVTRKKVEEEALNAIDQATVAVLQVEIANKNAAVAAAEKAAKDKAAADAAAEKAAKDKAAADAAKADAEAKAELQGLEKEAADIQRKANKAASDLEKAERDYKTALEAYNKNIVQNLTNEKIQAFANGGGFNQIGNRLNLQDPAIQAAAAEAAIAAGIADGSIRTFAQAGRAGRDAARAARDYASSQQGRQEAQDARRREQLQKEAARAAETGRKFDARKQAELDRLNQLQAGKDKQKADLEAAEKARKDAQDAVIKTAKSLANIEKKIDALTVK